MTDAGHAGIPYHLVLPYLGVPSYGGSTKIDRRLGEELDGLECFLPATFSFRNNAHSPSVNKYDDYLKLSESFVEEFGNNFRFYSFHACSEDPARVLASTQFNLAESSYDKGVEFLNSQSIIANNITNARCDKFLSGYKRFAPLMNVHLGRIRKGADKVASIDNIIRVLNKAAYDACFLVTIAVENMDSGKNGFYNVGECNDDIARVLDNVKNVSLTYDLGHVDAVAFNEYKKKGTKLPDSESGIADVFLDCQNKFMDEFSERISHMHLSFNDIFFSQKPNGYYSLGRHCPLTKAKEHKTFYEKAFKPVVKRALDIVEQNRMRSRDDILALDDGGEKSLGCVNLEIPRKRIFGVKVADCGGSVEEQLESIKIAKEIYKG